MKHYEMLCILPGTMTEEEVATFMRTVTETVTTHGATISSSVDKGKSRLAYPMKNIRYGYFNLVYFAIDPEKLADIERRIRLLGSVLRVIIRSYDPADEAALSGFSINPQVPIQKGEERMDIPPVRDAVHMDTQGEDEARAPREEKKEVTLEEIDSKLDEILEKDLSKV